MNGVILLAGKARAGKDSTANFLKDKLGGKVAILHFADYLKYILRERYYWDGKKDDAGRSLLQTVGTDKIRIGMKKPLFWAERVCDEIEIMADDFDYFIVADCRCQNESYFTSSRFPKNATTVRVNRIGFDNGLTEEQKNHISETDMDTFKYDYVINSESGLDKLEVEVENFMYWYLLNRR
jgi:hypothetical protein